MPPILPDLVAFADLTSLQLEEFDPSAPIVPVVEKVPYGIDFALDLVTFDFLTTRGGDLIVTNEMSALFQWCAAALITSRGRDLIFPETFGSDLQKLVSRNMPSDATLSEVPGRVRETLLVHDRIVDVKDFRFNQLADGKFEISFRVVTDEDEILQFEGLNIG